MEEGELSDDQDITVTYQEHHLSEEQTYTETMRGIRSFMGWSHIPDLDSATNTSEDNPFASSSGQCVCTNAYRRLALYKVDKIEHYSR